MAIDVGYRYHLDQAFQNGRVRPYVGGTIGLAFISEMDADLAVPELGPQGSGYALACFPDIWLDAIREKDEMRKVWRKVTR